MASSLLLPRQRRPAADGSGASSDVGSNSMKSTPLRNASDTTPKSSSLQEQRNIRPDNLRSTTDPSPLPGALLQGFVKDSNRNDWTLPRPHTSSSGSSHGRNRSPYSRSHLRSRSSGALLSAPPMARAHSMPNPHISRSFEGHSGRESPMRSRSPAYRGDDMPQRSPSWFETSSSATSLSGSSGVSGSSLGIEAIQEDSELDLTPRAQSSQSQSSAQNSPLTQHSASFSRSASLNRRRPASPLHSSTSVSPQPSGSFPTSVIDQGAPINMSASTSSGSNSPALGPQKYNEPHPSQMTLHHYASSSSFSSIPSTPTSARSRSPSISSLDTIEDAPEEEQESEAQLELERIERLKLAAEEGDESDDGGSGTGRRRNGSLDMPRFRGMGRGNERKRWSICGGERRADLDLETIWED